ncbi:hypothetical protein AB9T88_02305 [Flavobacterium sp. LBUM151]
MILRAYKWRKICLIFFSILFLIGCKDSTLKESKVKINKQKVTFEKNEIEKINSNVKNQDSIEPWKGEYYFESTNRDDLKTSFEIHIKQIDDISIKYISEDATPELYKHIIGELITPRKLKINFNKKYEEMGIIFLEKDENEYNISGEPIYFINPGSDNLQIKKIR